MNYVRVGSSGLPEIHKTVIENHEGKAQVVYIYSNCHFSCKPLPPMFMCLYGYSLKHRQFLMQHPSLSIFRPRRPLPTSYMHACAFYYVPTCNSTRDLELTGRN